MREVRTARAFSETSQGSGAFGRWILDEEGLPAYRYELDQYRDRRARYAHSFGLDRRDHWHQIGNNRVTALASNDGTVQVYIGDRGGTFLNHYEGRERRTLRGHGLLVLRWLARQYYELRKHQIVRQARNNLVLPPRQAQPITKDYAFSGGFSYIHDGQTCWSTAYRYRPNEAKTERIFGLGYFKTVMEYRGLQVTRRVYAPLRDDETPLHQALPLDDPALKIDIEIENTGAAPANFIHYEYWDVNLQQIKLQWLRTGLSGIIGDEERQVINQHFRPAIEWNEALQALHFSQIPPDYAPDPQKINKIDWSPPGVFWPISTAGRTAS